MTSDSLQPSASPLIESPFARLRALLEELPPGAKAIDMSIGEPRHAMPDFIGRELAASIDGFGKYPPSSGTASLRKAIAGWIARRYPGLSGAIDPEAHILPLNGSREGLFSAIFPAVERRTLRGKQPAILIPNPFYQCYAAAALAAGAEPVFLKTDAASGFLPDFTSIDTDILDRAAVIYICSPSNPQGAIASRSYLSDLITLAVARDIMIFSDECYSEIYYDDPPPGILEVAANTRGDFRNVLAFNSLSKRSNLPGLRSGFVAGDDDFIKTFSRFRNVVCPQIPLPIQHVSEAIWQDEEHVFANRDLYKEKLSTSKEIIGKYFHFTPPGGSFFLWLNVKNYGGGERVTATLWKECGVKVLPGAYLARSDLDGSNPGADYIRIALVQDLTTTQQALERIVKTLG
ncbi:MAG: aminotransferase class I/II-fold pyridoxal phosphate-dependent enzyme [Methyloligellaceae bacterium]